MTARFNVDRGWPDSRGSAVDETYVPTTAVTLLEGNIVTLEGAVGSPTVNLATATSLALTALGAAQIGAAIGANPTEAEIVAAIAPLFRALGAVPMFVVVEGNSAVAGNFSGSYLGKVVCLNGGGMTFSVPTALWDLNGGAAGTVWAPGAPVTVVAGLISGKNNGTADQRAFEVFGWVEDYNATTGLLTIVRK